MREFDHRGLLLASFQAKLCKESLEKTKESSPIFLRRLMKSNFIKKLDTVNADLLTLDVEEAFSEINFQFGESSYGKIRYSPNEMHWIGWFYRYVAYTRQIPSRLLYSLIKPEELRKGYYVYHTQSEEWVLDRVLSNLGYSEDDLSINGRLKKAIRASLKPAMGM